MTDNVKTLRESYYDYMGRRLREETIIDQRGDEIFELKQRIKKLEDDMSILKGNHE